MIIGVLNHVHDVSVQHVSVYATLLVSTSPGRSKTVSIYIRAKLAFDEAKGNEKKRKKNIKA